MPRPSRRRTALALAATALLLGNAGCTPKGRATSTDGPVKFDDGGYVQFGTFRGLPGTTIFFGGNVIINDSDKPATLDNAALKGNVPPTAATITQVRIRDLTQYPGDIDMASTWPYKDLRGKSQPTSGFILGLPPVWLTLGVDGSQAASAAV